MSLSKYSILWYESRRLSLSSLNTRMSSVLPVEECLMLFNSNVMRDLLGPMVPSSGSTPPEHPITMAGSNDKEAPIRDW